METNHTHTPGPWKVDSAGIVYDSRNNSIAHARYSNYLDEREQKANAQLIAAAPELLAALKLACELASNVERYGLDARVALTAVHKAAYAAITKI